MNSETIERLKQYPNARQCSIQVFSDRKDENKYSRILKMTDENLERCEKLQAKFPYWVYFSVNPMEDGKRDKESVKFIQTWITDIDEWDKSLQLELIEKAPLKPTFINESVHWFHLFYMATDHLTVEDFIEWNQWLKDYYNWDQKVVKDIARVLRLPWFLHYKADPVMVRWRKDLSSWMLYSPNEIYTAFPKKIEVVQQPEIVIKPTPQWSWSDDYRYRINQLDNRMMLLELSWTKRVNYEIIGFKRNSDWTEQITINWQPRSCWIDKNWLIGSYDDGWPWWVNRLQYYLKRRLTKEEWTDLLKVINANHPELEDKKKIEKIDIKPKEEIRKIWLEKPDFTRWEKGLDDAIGKLSKGQLVILSWETWAWKTTFATFMARKNPNSYYFVLEDTMGNIAKRFALKRAGITKKELNEWTRSEEKKAMFDTAYERFIKQEINYLDIGEKTWIESILEAMKELKEKWYSMFFIDNLWFIIGEGKTEMEQTADISAKLVSFCLKENVCVVLLHHFKKPSAWDKRRDISSLRWSGKLWDDAFFVANYRREDEGTLLEVLKDRTRWDLEVYMLGYDRGDFYLIENLTEIVTPQYEKPF